MNGDDVTISHTVFVQRCVEFVWRWAPHILQKLLLRAMTLD